jgi:hypothetical protein
MLKVLAGAFLGKMLLGGSSCECPDERSEGEDTASTRYLASVEPGFHVKPVYEFNEPSDVRFLVRSSEPIDVRFMRKPEYEKWSASSDFKTLRTHRDVKVARDTVSVRGGEYVLLFANNGPRTAAVSYAVWSRAG